MQSDEISMYILHCFGFAPTVSAPGLWDFLETLRVGKTETNTFFCNFVLILFPTTPQPS